MAADFWTLKKRHFNKVSFFMPINNDKLVVILENLYLVVIFSHPFNSKA